jgi:hypothetical protein
MLAAAAGVLLVGPLEAGVAAARGPRASGASARTARTFSLKESGRLHLTGKHGFTLNEAGSASGTIHGTIYIHLNVVAINRVTAEVNIYPSGGSLSGFAKADYRVGGATASFSGSMSISRGTGSYAHAHASGLSFSGTVTRSNDAVTVHLSGELSS